MQQACFCFSFAVGTACLLSACRGGSGLSSFCRRHWTRLTHSVWCSCFLDCCFSDFLLFLPGTFSIDFDFKVNLQVPSPAPFGVLLLRELRLELQLTSFLRPH